MDRLGGAIGGVGGIVENIAGDGDVRVGLRSCRGQFGHAGWEKSRRRRGWVAAGGGRRQQGFVVVGDHIVVRIGGDRVDRVGVARGRLAKICAARTWRRDGRGQLIGLKWHR